MAALKEVYALLSLDAMTAAKSESAMCPLIAPAVSSGGCAPRRIYCRPKLSHRFSVRVVKIEYIL